ncbi:MAG: PhnD/SsuA/transferrin family substrate-binding protein [Methylobacter sp.]
MTHNGLRFVKLLLVFVTFSCMASADDLFAEQTLRVGFHRPSFHDYSREELEISVRFLTQEMGKEVGIQTSVTIYDDIDSMRTEFEQGKINLIFASPLLVVTSFDNTLLADGFKMVIDGGDADKLVILTRKNEHMDGFKSLRHKKLSLVESDPGADLYVNFLSWTYFNKDYHNVFIEMPQEKKSHQAIFKLFFGQTDVVCVYDNIYQTVAEMNPQILAKIQIIAHINGILQGAGFFHKNVDPAFRERVITEALKLDSYARGRQFLELFKSDKVLRVSSTDLALSRLLYSDYHKLNKSK